MKTPPRFLCGLALLALAQPMWAQEGRATKEPTQVDPVELAIAGLLLEADLEDPKQYEKLERELAALGASSVPACFQILLEHRLEVITDADEVEVIPLSGDQYRVLFAGLTRMRGSAVNDFLAWHEPELDTDAEKSLAMRLLREVGKRRDIVLLVRLASPPPAARRLDLGKRESFKRALGGILLRDARAQDEILRSYRDAHPALVAPIVRTVGGLDSGQGLGLLVRLLGQISEADPLILVEISRLGDTLPHPLESQVLDVTRRYLYSSQPEVLMLAADACARLEDTEAAPELIGLLDHPLRAVGNEGYEALKVLTGLDYGKGSKRWEEWYDKNIEWWRYEAPELISSLSEDDPGLASHALLELSKWRFYRHEIAADVVHVLQREEKDLVILACAILGHLGSWRGVEPLVNALDDGEPEIQEAALRALKRITGESFGDWKSWRAYLAEQP